MGAIPTKNIMQIKLCLLNLRPPNIFFQPNCPPIEKFWGHCWVFLYIILPICCWCLVTKSCPILCNTMDGNLQAPLSMKFSKQEYWSGLPFPSPGNLPHPEIKPMSSALQADSLPNELSGKPLKPYINTRTSPVNQKCLWNKELVIHPFLYEAQESLCSLESLMQ